MTVTPVDQGRTALACAGSLSRTRPLRRIIIIAAPHRAQRLTALLAVLCTMLAAACPVTAMAQAWPTQPLKLSVKAQ